MSVLVAMTIRGMNFWTMGEKTPEKHVGLGPYQPCQNGFKVKYVKNRGVRELPSWCEDLRGVSLNYLNLAKRILFPSGVTICLPAGQQVYIYTRKFISYCAHTSTKHSNIIYSKLGARERLSGFFSLLGASRNGWLS